MKLAFIATDKSAIKTFNVLQQYYPTVHFYLANDNEEAFDLEVDTMPIMVDNVVIPLIDSLRTSRHKSAIQKNQKYYKYLMENIYPAKLTTEPDPVLRPDAVCEKYSVSDINFIKYNREIGKHTIENTKLELIEYDFLVIQNSQLIMSMIVSKQQNLFNSFTEQSKVLMTFTYELENLHKFQQEEMQFILIKNSLVDSIEDNWYFINLKHRTIQASLYVPVEARGSDEFINFLSDRVRTSLNKRFISFRLKEHIEHHFSPVDGYYTFKARLRNNKCGALVPTYTFWSKEKINSHLNQVIRNRMPAKKKEEVAANRI